MLTRRYFLLGAFACIASLGGYSWDLWRRFGSLPDSPPHSPLWRNGAFHNLPDPYIYPDLEKEPIHEGGWLKFLLSHGENRYPPQPVESVRINLHTLADGDFVWLGHSSFLLKLAGKIICIDPVLASRASPVPFTIPAWPGTEPYQASDFPRIDYLCLTHDHWDHLDYKAIKSLGYDRVLCGKGVGAHFKRWGLPVPEELDWHDTYVDGPLAISFTPSRHFSGRGLTRDQSLWGGFVINAGSGGNVYHTGDGGYGTHFADIGKKYGPFSIVFPDSGQYNRAWSAVHMFPEQAVQAVQDSRGRLAIPCHFGKFTLAWHPWNEPEQRFAKRAEQVGLDYRLPVIGAKNRIDGNS